MNVAPANPNRPRIDGGAIGCRTTRVRSSHAVWPSGEPWVGAWEMVVMTDSSPASRVRARARSSDRRAVSGGGPRGTPSAVLAALRADLGDARGFSVSAGVPMGAETAFRGQAIEARTPRPAELRLLRDGGLVAFSRGTALRHRARAPGASRVEAWRPTPYGPRRCAAPRAARPRRARGPRARARSRAARRTPMRSRRR